MAFLRMVLSRLGGVFGTRRQDDELDEEVRAHLDLLADEHRRRGLSRADAEAAALRDFGGIARTKESYREQRGLPFFDTLLQDLRYAIRMWRHTPGFSLVVVLVLALGIGVNSAMFTLVNMLLFRPLSGRAGDMLGLYSHDPTTPNSYRTFSYPNYADIRDRNDVFDELIAFTFAAAARPAGDVMRRTFVEVVSGNFFSGIGVGLAAGRAFTAEESKPGGRIPVAIASHASWQEAGFDPAFVGRTIRLNAQDLTIVGVAPNGFTGTTAILTPEFYLPMGMFESIVNDVFRNNGRGLADRSNTALMVAGRLKPGMRIDHANARLAALSADLERAYPAENSHQLLTVHTMSRVNISSAPSTDSGPAAMSAVLMPLSGGVLLIACLNIANMLLARATARKKEIAVRLALGGGRARIVRQLLTESAVLALAGAALGLAFGSWITRLFAASIARLMPSLRFDASPDLNIVLATTGFGVMSALVFGLAPALRSTRPDLVDDLKDAGGSRASGRTFGVRIALVVCQIAVSLMLMTAGGLFARGAVKASVADPGYRYDRLLLASIDRAWPATTPRRDACVWSRRSNGCGGCPASRQRRRTRRCRSATFTKDARWCGPAGATSFTERRPTPLYGRLLQDDRPADAARRDFTRAEEAAGSTAHVAIIDEPLGRLLFGNEDPIGQPLVIPPRTNQSATDESAPMTIVGVVPGIRDGLFDREPAAHLYVPPATHYRGTMHLHVRTSGASDGEMLDAIHRELRAVDDRLPVVDLRTMQDFHDRGLSLWVIRAAGRTLSGLGALALILAVIGVYGVKSYLVSQRTREIGIRQALGARPADIVWLLSRDGARLTLLGVAIGFPLAVVLGRLLSVAIFEVSPFDPLVLTLAPLVLAIAAAIATYLPARRGMRVSPLDALRSE